MVVVEHYNKKAGKLVVETVYPPTLVENLKKALSTGNPGQMPVPSQFPPQPISAPQTPGAGMTQSAPPNAPPIQ